MIGGSTNKSNIEFVTSLGVRYWIWSGKNIRTHRLDLYDYKRDKNIPIPKMSLTKAFNFILESLFIVDTHEA